MARFGRGESGRWQVVVGAEVRAFSLVYRD